jgi:hypothetical protein
LITKLIGTFLALTGLGLITPIGWRAVLIIWCYSISWAFVTDWAKTWVYRHFNLRTRHHERFLETVHHRMAHHSAS